MIDGINHFVYYLIMEEFSMTNAQKVNMVLAYKGITKTALAKTLNMSVQNLSQKLARDSLSTSELEQIAAALGGSYVFGFEFPDGTRI